jgi:NAD(P)H-hydrate epimerase
MVQENLSMPIVEKFIPARNSRSRKGDNGIVLVVGGSYIYHGAPILSSIAALKCGTDLVYTSVPKVNVTPTRAISPNTIYILPRLEWDLQFRKETLYCIL